MERQLKERLIGAAVLLAAAVVMVPEMFSGPQPPAQLAGDSAANPGQIKTYHIELQSADSSGGASPSSVDAPAAQPQDEVPAQPVESTAMEPVAAPEAITQPSSSSIASSGSAALRTAQPIVVAPKPADPPRRVETSPPGAGSWVVQIGSFGTQDKASQIVSKLKGQGYPAYLGTVTVSGKTLYRVRVGAMPARAAAESTLQRLKAEYPGASVIPVTR